MPRDLKYNHLMPSIRLCLLTPSGARELHLPGMDSLDAVTRQLPPGFYSTFRTCAGGQRVLGLRQHLERLYRPAADHGLQPCLAPLELRRSLADLLSGTAGETRLRLVLAGDGQLYAALEPLVLLPPQVYREGVRLVTFGLHRDQPRLKSTSFIESSQPQRRQLEAAGAFEALMLRRGYILEGLTSNFFYVRDGCLGTARRGVLLGVTRRTVLRLARSQGLAVLYHPLKPAQIPLLSEAFITSSSRALVPVVQIDSARVGEGIPGPLTHRLSAAYEQYLLARAEPILPD